MTKINVRIATVYIFENDHAFYISSPKFRQKLLSCLHLDNFPLDLQKRELHPQVCL